MAGLLPGRFLSCYETDIQHVSAKSEVSLFP
jgi:hypothetical protein